MKKQIAELLNEKFTWEPQRLQFSAEKLEQSAPPQMRIRGKFTVSSSLRGMLQGFVYSSNSRVKCTPEMFVGREETFYYEADMTGLREGDCLEGELVFCETSGEYRLPYAFTAAEKETPKEPEETAAFTCEQLASLAQEDFAKAYMLFASRHFPDCVQDAKDRWLALYEGLAGQSLSYHSLEQFLIGLGYKEPVTLELERDNLCLQVTDGFMREEVILTKNTWGFAALKITSDAPFLTVERPFVTTEEFVGSAYNLGFVIQKEKLHAGRSFARITVTCGCRTYVCTVEARLAEAAAPSADGRAKKRENVRLLDAYIRSRSGKLDKREWRRLSMESLNRLGQMGEDAIFYRLYRVYLLYLSDKRAEAQMCLKELAGRKDELAVPQWRAFYRYLTLFENREKEYELSVKNEIHGLFLANRENWMLQWLILHRMGDSFRNDSERLEAVRRQYGYGCASPVMYLEASDILRREPLMLRTLGNFEIHLLRFMCKEKLLNLEICGQAAQLAGRTDYQPLLLRVLMDCYEQYPSRNLLSAICSLLMKGRRSDAQFERWFRLGIDQDLRLAGLYEHYAQTAQDLNRCDLPQILRMYFSYNNTLDSDKKAALYVNILSRREEDPQSYETYLPAIERFMEEQLTEGRISDDLAQIYKTLLPRYAPEERLIDGLSRVLYACEIVCKNPQIRHVIVRHRHLPQEHRAQLMPDRACAPKYGPGCCILLEDADGARYADPSLFTEQMLLPEPELEAYCRAAKELPASLLLHDLAGEEQVSAKNAAQFVSLLKLSDIQESSRLEIQERMLLYFASNPYDDALEEFLQTADLNWLAGWHMQELAELLTAEGMIKEACGLVWAYGAEHVSSATLARLCSHCVSENSQEDAKLVSLCAQSFARGVYDEKVLAYLMRWYEGPADTMKALFAAGQRFLLEEPGLEEKILALVLFMRAGMEGTESVFAAYRRHMGKARLCRAYSIWMSYCYFVRGMQTDGPVFDYIEQMVQEGADTPQVCQLALLCRYAGCETLTEEQQGILYHLLEKFVAKGMYFRFYQKLPPRLLRRFHLHDKYFLEYRADPGSHVTLHYRLNGGRESAVPMNHTYEGIFTCAFSLFYQDRLEWYVSAEHGRETLRTSRQTIVCGRRAHRGSFGKYELINRLAEAQHRGDHKEIRRIRDQYVGQQYLVDELFQIN